MYFPTPLPLVPVALIVAAWVGLYGSIRLLDRDRFESFIAASVGLGILLWLVSEIQGRFQLLSFSGAVATWTLTAGLSLLLLFRLRQRSHRTPAAVGSEISSPLGRGDKAILIAILLTVALIGLVAWLTPVMAWDALAYHVPRFLYWVRNGSIEPFPTANDRHIFMGPWPALTQMQIYLLAGSDRLAHALQWLSMIGSLVVAAAIARKLGAGPRGQLTAAAVVVTIPMGIQQATTALTDHTAGFWLIILAYYTIAAYRSSRFGWLERLAAGGALGLAVLSKGTSIPIAAPWLVGLVLAAARRGRGAVWRTLLAVGLTVGLLNAPQLTRNLATFGHPLAPPHHHELVRNQSFRPQYVISNLIRHTLVHLGSWEPAHAQPLIALSDSLHRLMGIEDGDPLNSHKGQRLQIQPLRRKENLAGNPLHLILYVMSASWLALRRRGRFLLVRYGVLLLSGYLLFVLLLKYQLSISSLQLPFFILAAPWAAALIDDEWSQSAVLGTAWVFLLAAVPWVVWSESRPLLGADSILTRPRSSLLYHWGPEYRPSATGLAQQLRKGGKKTVGLVTDGETLEYYIWYEIRRRYKQMPRIENLEPDEEFSPRLSLPSNLPLPPRYVGCFGLPEAPERFTIQGRSYIRVRRWKWSQHSLYKRIRNRPAGAGDSMSTIDRSCPARDSGYPGSSVLGSRRGCARYRAV